MVQAGMRPTTVAQALLEPARTAPSPEFRETQKPSRLTGPELASASLLDLLAVGDFALIHTQGEATLWVTTDPGLEDHCRPLLAIVGERNKHPFIALLALGKFHHPHLTPAPAKSR
jgi:hypothetical protein